MVRQAHHLTTLSQVEGQITMTKMQNTKQLVFWSYTITIIFEKNSFENHIYGIIFA